VRWTPRGLLSAKKTHSHRWALDSGGRRPSRSVKRGEHRTIGNIFFFFCLKISGRMRAPYEVLEVQWSKERYSRPFARLEVAFTPKTPPFERRHAVRLAENCWHTVLSRVRRSGRVYPEGTRC